MFELSKLSAYMINNHTSTDVLFKETVEDCEVSVSAGEIKGSKRF